MASHRDLGMGLGILRHVLIRSGEGHRYLTMQQLQHPPSDLQSHKHKDIASQ